jgi:hypothetical protein
LLVPDIVAERYLGDNEPVSALTGVAALSQAAKIPWMQAAKRFSELQGQFNFLRVRVPPQRRIKIIASTFPNQKERGRLLHEESSFVRFVRALSSKQPNWLPHYLETAVLTDSGIPSFSDALEAAVCFRKSVSEIDAYFAVAS